MIVIKIEKKDFFCSLGLFKLTMLPDSPRFNTYLKSSSALINSENLLYLIFTGLSEIILNDMLRLSEEVHQTEGKYIIMDYYISFLDLGNILDRDFYSEFDKKTIKSSIAPLLTFLKKPEIFVYS